MTDRATTEPVPGSASDPRPAVRAAYGAFAAAVRQVDDELSWAPTGCTGWAVRDLVYHCALDAQRALVALHTPAATAPDRDAVDYWLDFRQQADAGSSERAAQGRRFARTVAGMFLYFEQLRGLYLETAAAVLDAVDGFDRPARPVGTQGHVLSAADLIRTLTVEATVHHLDLTAHLPQLPGPSAAGLAEVRRTLDGLLGGPAPAAWDDLHYARAGTGRTPLTAAERTALGATAERFPLLS